jgi:hypothetical protein
MSYKKRQEPVVIRVRVDVEIEKDLRILYSLAKYNKGRKELPWNEFIEGILIRHISSNSEVVLKVRSSLAVVEGEK